MPENYYSYRSLPLEVLNDIMQTSTKHELCNYALVCKSWSKAVQSILFSVVNIKSLSQLKTLDETVINKPYLGEQVKVLSIRVPGKNDKYLSLMITKHLTNLLNNGLPNLQELPKCPFPSYTPILSALENSRLERLKVLCPPDEGGKMEYASCILLMQSRVEKIKISSLERGPCALAKDSLFSNLGQFSMLKEIEIDYQSKVSGIQTIEHITATCKNLKKLIFGSNSRLTDAAVEVYPPSKNIEYFYGHLELCESLPYVMHKFPQLNTLLIDFWYGEMELEDYTRLLEYMSTIKTVDLGKISIDYGVVAVTANYWEETSAALGSKTVGVCCNDVEEENCSLRIDGQSSFFFLYYIPNYELEHIEVIESMGKYIGEFYLDYELESIFGEEFPDKEDLPEQVMHYLSLHCPHLHTLHISGFILRARDAPQQALSLSDLRFRECVFVGNFLSKLSARLPHLKLLVLQNVDYQPKLVRNAIGDDYHYDDKDKAFKIIMPETQIDTIIIHKYRSAKDKPVHVKLLVVKEKNYHYYRHNNGLLLPSIEKEYNEVRESDRIYICCSNKARINLN